MTVDEFLEFLFQGVKPDDPDEVIVICGDGAKSHRTKLKKNENWWPRRWVPGELGDRPGRTYFCISTVVPRPKGSVPPLRQQVSDCKLTYVIALDDVGTKIPWARAAALPTPNIKLKTSEVTDDPRGNQQWFYALAYGADPVRAAALIDGLSKAGLTDDGADRANRWMRVPGSTNLNHEGWPAFNAVVIDEGVTDVCMSLAQLEVALKPLGVVASEPRDALEPIVPLEDEMADPVFRWLMTSPLSPLKKPAVRAANGWWPVNCPWEKEHESGKGGGTDYFPGRGFKCQHGTCKKNKRNVPAFRAWCLEQDPEAGFTAGRNPLETVNTTAIGADLADAARGEAGAPGIFPPTPEPLNAGVYTGATPGLRLAEHISTIVLHGGVLPEPEQTAKEEIAKRQPITDAGVHAVMAAIGLSARRNMMTGDVEVALAGYERVGDLKDLRDVWGLLVRACTKCGMAAQKLPIWHAGEQAASDNKFHPVLEWIDSKDWDGTSRIQALCDTLVMADPMLNKWRDVALKRWLLQGAMAWQNWQRPVPIDVPYCLVLQGDEGANKSKWFKHALLPPQFVAGDMSMALGHGARDRDAITRVTGRAITELGELNAIFKKTDLAAFKNMLSTLEDIYRPPYGLIDLVKPRCTIFGASVNPADFLADPTGERRLWTLAVIQCLWEHGIDLQQLWAEVAYKADREQYWLTDSEAVLHKRISRGHHSDTDANEIVEHLDYLRGNKDEDDTWIHVTAGELLEGYRKPPLYVSRMELNAKLTTMKWSRNITIKGKKGWKVPNFRAPMTAEQRGSLIGLHTVMNKKPLDKS